AARIVCECGVEHRQSRSSELLRDLHWLAVHNRITFMSATLCFKAHRLNQPPYLSYDLQQYVPLRNLRSLSLGLLVEPFARTKIGSRRFSVAAPHIWNELPSICGASNT